MAKRKHAKHQHGRAKPHDKVQTVKNKSVAAEKRQVTRTIPFDAEDRILLVGEGDFSFARSIVENHGCYGVTATCLDPQEELYSKYDPQGRVNTKYLEDESQNVLYSIDATSLEKHKTLSTADHFDKIIFNFPHVGGKSKDVNRQVRFNQELLVKFFASSLKILSATGTIVVTLFEGEPYTLWNIKDLARHSGLAIDRSFPFMADAYPGYSHARTLGNIEGGGGWKGEDRKSRSYVFQRKGANDANAVKANEGKRKRSEESDSEED